MQDSAEPNRSPSLPVWVAAYFLFATVLPFLCLRRARAIGNLECVLGVMAGLLVQVGMIPVLGATDGNPMQIFVLLTMLMSFYLIVFWQFLAGKRAGLWSDKALKQWRAAGIFFACFIAFALAAAIAQVKLQGLHP